MKKKLFLVGSPPASGKTYVAQKLSALLNQPVYLDKDTIIPLSKAAFKAANEPYNRDSKFFNTYIRDAEYEAIIDVAFEALMFNAYVILNAPFTKEFRDNEYMAKLKQRAADIDAELVLIWVHCDEKLIHERMIARNSERDKWKLENWEAYLRSKDHSIPETEGLYIIENIDQDSVVNQIERMVAEYRDK